MFYQLLTTAQFHLTSVRNRYLIDWTIIMHCRAMRYLTLGETGRCIDKYLALPSERRKYFIAIQTYKILYELSPTYLFSSVQYSESVSHRPLRNKYRVRVPPIKSNYGRKSFYFSCTAIWNKLTTDLYSCTTLNCFKSLFKSFFKL